MPKSPTWLVHTVIVLCNWKSFAQARRDFITMMEDILLDLRQNHFPCRERENHLYW